MMTEKDVNKRYYVLIEFAYKHLDFLMAELESVLDMDGIELGSTDCEIVALPNQTDVWKRDQKRASGYQSAIRPFLIISLPFDSKFVPRYGNEELFRKPSDIAYIILSRCTLVRNVMELWGAGSSITKCLESTKNWVQNSTAGQTIFPKAAEASESWKITIHTLGSRYSFEEQAAMRSNFSFLNFHGAVKMDDPSNEFVLIREVELDASGSVRYPRHSHLGKHVLIPENDARPPLAWYFARTLAGSRCASGRGDSRYSLKKRSYLGPTSMDHELSLVMCNLGRVRKGSIAFDPFVGTGSILLSCAIRGAYCIGTDIDIRVLRGRSADENVWSNFRQFHLPRPELVRSDNAIYHRHYRMDHPLYDAIICDPPYGIRAGARKTGSRLDKPRPILEEHRHDHIAQTKPYAVSDVMSDLLDVAARTLVMGGRLVYIIPSFSDFDEDSDLPRHECLKTVHICYQPLSAELGRRVVASKCRLLSGGLECLCV